MYKKYYSLFLEKNKNIQHYASHSHHYWPDVTRDAMLEYWDTSASFIDDKWNYFFETKIPMTQKLIANVLNLTEPQQISFAANTHEFVTRLLSCFGNKKIKVLTTDSEFYSFDRQINRLKDLNFIDVIKIPTMPFESFENRFIEKCNEWNPDLIFTSQVFFNSGVSILDLTKFVNLIYRPNRMVVIDAYHAFMAVPTDLKPIQDKIFYLAGSYKYAQGGEGCCFLFSPKNNNYLPANTGWFAGFQDLSKDENSKAEVGVGAGAGVSAGGDGAVTFLNDGSRFAGSTMDYSALFRLNAVLTLFEKENITVQKIHQHIQMLQNNFREHIKSIHHPHLNEKNILSIDYQRHGHFYAFALPSYEYTQKIHDELRAHNIWTDYRGSRLRFGFGLYQEDCINLGDFVRGQAAFKSPSN